MVKTNPNEPNLARHSVWRVYLLSFVPFEHFCGKVMINLIFFLLLFQLFYSFERELISIFPQSAEHFTLRIHHLELGAEGIFNLDCLLIFAEGNIGFT